MLTFRNKLLGTFLWLLGEGWRGGAGSNVRGRIHPSGGLSDGHPCLLSRFASFLFLKILLTIIVYKLLLSYIFFNEMKQRVAG